MREIVVFIACFIVIGEARKHGYEKWLIGAFVLYLLFQLLGCGVGRVTPGSASFVGGVTQQAPLPCVQVGEIRASEDAAGEVSSLQYPRAQWHLTGDTQGNLAGTMQLNSCVYSVALERQ